MRGEGLRLLFSVLGGLILLFIALPILKLLLSSSPEGIREAFWDPAVREAIRLSILGALAATGIGLLLGVPLGYVLARSDFPGKRFVEGLVDLPMAIPHSAAGIALLFVFGRKFLLGKAFHSAGISFVGAFPGIVAAMLFVSIPFLVSAARDGFGSVDPRLEKAARTLGASPWRTFFEISLPLARRHILSGAILMWARGISEFGAVVILAYHPMTAPVLLWDRFASGGLEAAGPVAFWIIIACLGIFLAARLWGGRR